MIALRPGQSEQALLENGIVAVPQREREAQMLAAFADAEQPVFVPAIRFRAGMVVRKIVPRAAVRAVILAHGSPRPLGQVRPPFLPIAAVFARLMQALFFFSHAFLPFVQNKNEKSLKINFRHNDPFNRLAAPTM